MKEICETFDKSFKALWVTGSDVNIFWNELEDLYACLKNIVQSQAQKLSKVRTLNDIKRDVQAASLPRGVLYVEWVNLLCNRIILRTQLKVRDSLQIFFYSSNTGNAYGCALASRSIIEHVALLQYLTTKTSLRDIKVIPRKEAVDFAKRIRSLAFGSNFDWNKLLNKSTNINDLQVSGEWNRPASERIPRIADLVQALSEELFKQKRLVNQQQLRFTYGILCDVVHPSWGGDFIYAPGMQNDMMFSTMNPDQGYNDHFKLSTAMFGLPVVEMVRHLIQLSVT